MAQISDHPIHAIIPNSAAREITLIAERIAKAGVTPLEIASLDQHDVARLEAGCRIILTEQGVGYRLQTVD